MTEIPREPRGMPPRSSRYLGRHLGLALSVLALWVAILVVVNLVVRETGGRFVYPLDDAYIHMATAKHFSQHLTWGVTPYAFSSSVSSIAWPLLISGLYALTGPVETGPLILNLVTATALLVVVHMVLLSDRVRPLIGFLVLLALLYLTPLPAMVLSGQEHILHLLFTILFLFLTSRVLAQEQPVSSHDTCLLCLTAAGLTASRYEGLFLIGVAAVLLMIRRGLLVAILVGVSSLLPLSVYGLISMVRGWPCIPASVLLHGKTASGPSIGSVIRFLHDAAGELMAAGHVRFLLVAAVALLAVRVVRERNTDPGPWNEHTAMLLMFIATTVQHVLFARMGAYYRYEAYLVGSGVLFLSLSLNNLLLQKGLFDGPKAIASGLCLVMLLAVVNPVRLFSRASASVVYTPLACSNVFEQQYQMGLFLKTYYQGESVGANDIGAINFLADLRCCDLVGLASLDVFRAKRAGAFGTEAIRRVTQQEGVKIAILYDSWFTGKTSLPREWIALGHWSLQENVAVGGHTVTFYAVAPEHGPVLRKQLREFSSRLPEGVIQSGDYTAAPR